MKKTRGVPGARPFPKTILAEPKPKSLVNLGSDGHDADVTIRENPVKIGDRFDIAYRIGGSGRVYVDDARPIPRKQLRMIEITRHQAFGWASCVRKILRAKDDWRFAC